MGTGMESIWGTFAFFLDVFLFESLRETQER